MLIRFSYRRTTYVIGTDGVVKNVFESFFSHNYHVTSVLKVLQKDEVEAVEEQEEEEQ